MRRETSFPLHRIQRKVNYIKGESREQELLLPERLEDYVEESNPVRFIEAFVDKLDMQGCGFERSVSNSKGRPGYDPRDLLKLYLYGYMNRTRSSRMLEKACHVNMEAIWLMGKLQPDHKTIAEFRRKNPKAFKGVFRKFVVLCRGMGLLGGDLVAIDGTQLKAVNNPKRNLARSRLKRMMAQADKKIAEYTKRLDDEDAREKGGRKLDRRALAAKIDSLETELESMQVLEEAMEKAEVNQISDTDEESRAMSKNPRIAVGYNAQASADGKHGLVVAEDLSNDVHDYDHLAPMAEQSKENLGCPESLDVLADKGYDKASQMKQVEDLGMRCHVPERKSKGGGSNLYSKESFRYLKTKDAYRCPAGKLLPRRYETVKQGKLHYAYTDLGICQGCSIRSNCTRNERGRTVWRREDEHIAERARRRMEKEPETYKRRGEWSLMCACYNIKRTISTLGVEKLAEEVSSRKIRHRRSASASWLLRYALRLSKRLADRVSKKACELDTNRLKAQIPAAF